MAIERWSDELQQSYSFFMLGAYVMGLRPVDDGQQLARRLWDAHTHALLPEGLSLGRDGRSTQADLEELSALRRQVQVRDDFIAVAGHELATPITALTLQLRALMKPAAALVHDSLRQRLEGVSKTLQHLSHLATCLLDVTRARQDSMVLERRVVDLREVATQGVALCEPALDAAGCACAVDCGDHAVEGLWDPLRLRQVLQNLLSNAIKYGAQASIEVAVHVRDGEGILSVSDHGPGIPPADRERIFEPYERATERQQGLGIGLWLAQQIARAHGGRIAVDSKMGLGTRMDVQLPLASCPQHLGTSCVQAVAEAGDDG